MGVCKTLRRAGGFPQRSQEFSPDQTAIVDKGWAGGRTYVDPYLRTQKRGELADALEMMCDALTLGIAAKAREGTWAGVGTSRWPARAGPGRRTWRRGWPWPPALRARGSGSGG